MTQGFFNNDHMTQGSLPEGSMGRSVGTWELVQQLFRQQVDVDAARALDEELRERWLQSLRGLRTTGQNFNEPTNPFIYRGYAQFLRDGTPVNLPSTETYGGPVQLDNGIALNNRELDELRRANEAIRQLNNPEIRTFEQILEEVSSMQRETEEQTASMSERAGWFANLVGMSGSIAGSFTTRDPLNLVTAHLGWGRTIATRIATDMAIAAGVVGATEYTDVQPNRAIAGLLDRNPLYNIAAATIGAGLIRGGIEGIGVGVRRLRERSAGEEIDFDLRDSQLQQMFDANPQSPTARAGSQALDDIAFVERNNPYGEGRAANERFIAELRQVQRAMDGEPMTAIARVLPPVPFEYIRKAADFEIVREQQPLLYARMEQAQAKLADIQGRLDQDAAVRDAPLAEDVEGMTVARYVDAYLEGKGRGDSTFDRDMEQFAQNNAKEIEAEFKARAEEPPEVRVPLPEKELKGLRAERRAANKEYQTAYRAVEAEAVRLREAQARIEAVEQGKAASILAVGMEGRSFIGPELRHDYVQELVDRINTLNDALDETAAAPFVRQTTDEGAAPRETWDGEEGIDIGLEQPIDRNFNFITEDGDMTVAQAMRDLQDDADLDDAMRTCLI